MAELKYEPVSHDHKAFLKNARKRETGGHLTMPFNDLPNGNLEAGETPER